VFTLNPTGTLTFIRLSETGFRTLTTNHLSESRRPFDAFPTQMGGEP
jgi:hypothetical protein